MAVEMYDGTWTYDESSGTYDGALVAGSSVLPQLVVEVGFSIAAFGANYLYLDDVARGLLDTDTLFAGDVVLWTDVTDYVEECAWFRGAQRVEGVYGRYEAGHATIVLDNKDRRFDPTNLAGPYVSAGVTQVLPMKPIRIRATANGVTYDLYRGFVDTWGLEFFDPGYSTSTVQAIDAVDIFANFNPTAVAPVGEGELSGARINRILDNMGWASSDRVIAAGESTMQATTLSTPAWTELLVTADSEIGELYIDGAGRIVFRQRHALATENRSNTPRAVFGDDPAEFPYEDAPILYDRALVRNRINVSRTGGTLQTANDTASQAANQIRTWGRTDLLLQSDGEVAAYGTYVLSLNKDVELRFSKIDVLLTIDSVLTNRVLARELGDRITVNRRPPGGGALISRDAFIRGISGSISKAGPEWRFSFTLQSATPFASTVFTLDSSTRGVLNTNALIGY